jgi:anti-sigma factor RsiW
MSSEQNTHPEELLPWFVNNTLNATERAQVQQHLDTCGHCQQEVALLRAIQSQVKQTAASTAPGDLGLKRLLRDVKQAQRKPRSWLPMALAASIAVIMVQAVMLGVLIKPDNQAIVPLGTHYADKLAHVQVRFVPSASEAEIRGVLNDIGGVIIDGPGALGVYHIRINTIQATDAPAIARIVQTLRARTKVVQQANVE